jgi:hypothetical protein
MKFAFWKSKTFWGTVFGVVATLVKNPHIGGQDIVAAIGPVLDAVQAGGAGLAVIGLRDGQAKNGTGQ